MIDVLVTSTCRMTIKRTLESFTDRVTSSDGFRFLVNIDVVHPWRLEQVQNVLHDFGITQYRVNDKPQGHAAAVSALYEMIESDYYFSLEDDWIFCRDIDLDVIKSIMEQNYDIDIIRLNKEINPEKEWLYHKSDYKNKEYVHLTPKDFNGYTLLQNVTWTFNPSLARYSTLKAMLPIPIDVNPEQYLCHRYDEYYRSRGSYIWGAVGDSRCIRDIGRNQIRSNFRKIKNRILYR